MTDTTLDLGVFDINPADLGTLPNFDPWYTGDYRKLKAVLELKTIGSTAEGNKWQFAEVKVQFTDESAADMQSADDKPPSLGDSTTFQYDIIRTDKTSKQEYNCAGKHTSPDGTVREAGGLTRMLKDWGSALELDTPKEVAARLGEGVVVRATITRKIGATLKPDGSERINQYIDKVELD